MTLELWGITSLPYIELPRAFWGTLLALGAAALVLGILASRNRDFRCLRPAQWGLLAALVLAAPALSEFLLIRAKNAALLSPPGVPAISQSPPLALFGAVPWVLAAGLLGPGPAVLVGLVSGLARGLWETHSLFSPLETALLAGLVAGLIRQEFRGVLATILRHPVLAALAASGAFWPVLYLTYGAYSPVSGLAGLDYIWALVAAAAPLLIAEATLGGLAGELVRAGFLRAWPRKVGIRPPPYARRLNLRITFSLIPLGLVGIGLLFWADNRIAINVASDLVVDQMGRSAENASRGIPFFIQTGRSLAGDLARNLALEGKDSADLEGQLEQDLRAVPYFRQLVYFDADQRPAAGYPIGDFTQLKLTEAEAQAVTLGLQGVPQDMVVYPAEPGEPILLAFSAPATDPAGNVVGVLLGRVDLETNPLMQPVLKSLQSVVAGEGIGFLVDDRERIIYHSDPLELLRTFQLDPEARPLPTTVSGAVAYQDVAPDGTRRLVFYLPVVGHRWSVVIQTPYNVVLALATRISAPLVFILFLVGIVALILISYLARRLTRPVEALVLAVGHMGDGDMSAPLQVGGEDEVGRLGHAFEQMRRRLRARLDELNLLLKVSQGVAASLSMDQAVLPILQGALAASGASGVRLVLSEWDDPVAGIAPAADGAGRSDQSFALGPVAPLMVSLDRELLALAHDEGRVIIENFSRARAVLSVSKVAGKIQALIALPLQQENAYSGVLWLGYDAPHTFTEPEVNFLTTLAGQAAAAVANVRLFQTAERGRERLSAILSSTPDAIIVTDRSDRLILTNPTAEEVFGLDRKTALRRPVTEMIKNPALLAAIRTPGEAPAASEVQVDGGRTLSASSSLITADDGKLMGRVCVLRDITRFKELEALKTEFVTTVSHDLRTPLFYIRGFATMLPMVGSLNDKQKEFAQKILDVTEEMTELIDDLLDINRIEAGIGLRLETLNAGDILQTVAAALRQQAIHKGLTLQVDLPEGLPPLSGDSTLLRQALGNLVENAIKFTPRGGSVRVRGGVQDHSPIGFAQGMLVLSVQDTGLGIAPADQAHLFERFYRVKQRETADLKGAGLGLAIVKSIAERHGGRVWVESRLGQGSTFFMAVPLNGQQPSIR